MLPFRNALEYQNANWQLRSALNVVTPCKNSVMFGAVTAEKRLLIFVPVSYTHLTLPTIYSV